MALIKCKECSGQVSTDAKSCPHCGTRSFKKSNLGWYVGALIIIWIFISRIDNTPPLTSIPDHIAAQPQPQPITQSRPILNPIKASCSKVARLFGDDSSLSSIQKDDLWKKNYVDKAFKWNLQLINADSSSDGFEVWFTCLPPEEVPSIVRIFYPESFKEKVLSLKKGIPISISGILKEYEVPPSELSGQANVRFTADVISEK